MQEGIIPIDEVARTALQNVFVTEDHIQNHTLRCLTWLLKMGRLDIKIAFMKDAMFHPKVWLFQEQSDSLAVHGSSNLTYAGIQKNIEQVAVSKSWEDPSQRYITKRLHDQFSSLWDDKDDNCIVVDMPDAVRERLVQTHSSTTPPQEADLRSLYRQASIFLKESSSIYLSEKKVFAIPPWLRYEDGPFAHQGKAVGAWCDAGHNGILEMATGSGKTIAAMIAAFRLYETSKPLLIVVSAPYIPLVQQWCDEIEAFGVDPVNLTESIGPRGRARVLGRLRRRLRSRASEVESIVVSHRTLSDGRFQAELERFACTTLLIADEAHNLGSEGFISNPPEFFDHKLGLSATPVRQYDAEGTEALFDFLGPVVYQFGLKDAIGNCLVEYDYFVHSVNLTEDEMDRWHELTELIRVNAWRQEQDSGPDEYLTKLLRDRRAILELAENKIEALKEAIDREDLSGLRHTLVYASDKDPQQLDEVNRLLSDRGILFHQLTYEETADRDQTSNILRSFQEGTLRVLTAKRVLDEGINIPQIQKAFILASTTVERQWVQRRGRLLRKCEEIGKTHSEVHDFVVVPPNMDSDDDSSSLVKTELERVQEFAKLARNAGRSDGPLSAMDTLVEAAFN
ncbi:MAG: DEAD/DEAH box helicase [Dehalococcoidia bacterium]|nr:DEAD/DEAH box helicase [Dehalococcoidia bacterium]